MPSSLSDVALFGDESPGVRRIEALSRHFTRFDKFLLFFGLFMVSYAYGLDSLLRIVYTPYATASFKTHSLLSTINVVKAVIAAAAQPTAAKLADVFGRIEMVMLSVFFYVLGTILDASSDGVKTYCTGIVFYQLGYTIIILMVEVIVADVTSLRSRVFFSYINAAPFIINTWVSGNITNAVLGVTTWRWGIGMFAIIYPVCALPIIGATYRAHHRAKRAGNMEKFKSTYDTFGMGLYRKLFWQLDVIGILLVVLIFGFILVPLTLAGGIDAKWGTARIIAPLVIGICFIPVFVVFEMKTATPMLPFHLLKDRGVWGALAIAIMYNFAWTMQGDYLYTVLFVSFNESVTSATRIASLFTFTSTVTGIIIGVVVYKVRRLKIFIMSGTCLFLVAFGVLIYFRGAPTGASHNGIVGGQILLGIAGGMFPYPTQASIQAASKHEHVAIVTGLYLACYNIGSALGNSVSGAIWTHVLPDELEKRMGSKIAAKVYADPITAVTTYPLGTPERDDITGAFRRVQFLLCVTGLALCVPLIGLSFVLRDPVLTHKQSQFESDSDEDSAPEGGQAKTSRVSAGV